MVSDKHLLIDMHMVCSKHFNYNMQVVSSRWIFNQSINFIYVVNMIYSKYKTSMIFSWLCHICPYNILLIMLHTPIQKIYKIFWLCYKLHNEILPLHCNPSLRFTLGLFPRNAYAHIALNYTRKYRIQYTIQISQHIHEHIDQHFC